MCSSDLVEALFVREYTYAGSTTCCIQTPMLEVKLDSHITLNSRWARADRAEPGTGGLRVRAVDVMGA